MWMGTFVGVPLTLLQWGCHPHHVDPVVIGCNFLLGHAIYDADRMTSDVWDVDRTTTRIAAVGATGILASHEGTLWAAPLVPLLHFGYTPLKPVLLAPIKPFFVAAMWAALVYYVPLGIMDSSPPSVDVVPTTITTPASIALCLATLSHVLDIVDIGEDQEQGAMTPAVVMGEEEAGHYTIALALATLVVYSHSPLHSTLVDLVFLTTVASLSSPSSVPFSITSITILGLLVAAVVKYDAEALGFLLQTTEVTHKLVIEQTLNVVEWARTLPPPWKRRVLEMTIDLFKFGDQVGSQIIHLYEMALRGEL